MKTEPRRGLAADAALGAASLLRGGVSTGRVWRALGDEPEAPKELVRLIAQLDEGCDTATALATLGGEQWRVLAAAWRLAEQSGAPIAAVLERLAEALSDLERLGERRSVLLAGPRATIRLMAALPLVALLFGMLLGFDPMTTLLTPFGAVIVGLGGALLIAGVRWARALSSRLESAAWVSGLECELCWVALAGGAAHAIALRRVVDVVDALSVRWVRLSTLRRDGTIHSVLSAATTLGTSAEALLLAEAQSSRARALAELERSAEQLGVRVLLPIGICVLPAFILLGVLPVLMAVMGSLGPLGAS